jgi:hypothetical protein
MRKGSFVPLLSLAIALGFLIAWVDSRPSWDDTGVTAGVVFLTAAIFGALRPSRAPLWALAVGIWIPLFGIIVHKNFGSLLALAVAVCGAYAGAMTRRFMAPPGAK